MKPWFRFALVCLAIVCLLLSLSQQAGSNYQLPVARSGGWIGIETLRPPQQQSSKSWNSIRLALDLSNLWSSTVR
jgi:hypothetical protein